MIISDMYQTKIEASNYNANIDSTNNVITVTLLDFNNQPVTNKSVTLSCDKGYFTKKGSTSISGTTTKSVTVNTDSNGKITATWTASEWGLCTFSANNNKVQINVKGWKVVQGADNLNSYFHIRVNGEGLAELNIHYNQSAALGRTGHWWNIDSPYRPRQDVGTLRYNYGVYWVINLTQQGLIEIGTLNDSNATLGGLWGQIVYRY